jgi:hypothetical protein
MILSSQQNILDNYAAIGRDMEALAKDMPAVALTAIPLSPPLLSYCDTTAPLPRDAVTQAGLIAQSDRAANTQMAVPPADLSHLASMRARQCSLYWRMKRATEDIAAVTLHLVSWTRVVIGWRPVGDVFGVDHQFILESAGMHDEMCKRLGLETEANGHCGPQLLDVIYHTREVADSLLGCISLYLLLRFTAVWAQRPPPSARYADGSTSPWWPSLTADEFSRT